MAKCTKCEKEIRWVITPAGKSIPLDPEPVKNGRYVVPKGDNAKIATDADRRLLRPTFACHWDNCRL